MNRTKNLDLEYNGTEFFSSMSHLFQIAKSFCEMQPIFSLILLTMPRDAFFEKVALPANKFDINCHNEFRLQSCKEF